MQDNVHKGHRQRMRRKLYEFSHRVFDTYELLEMLLYHSVALRDTNPLAKLLLSQFGSLSGVLQAPREELCLLDGIGEATAGLISAVNKVKTLSLKNTKSSPPSLDYQSAGELAVCELAGCMNSEIKMISLDNSLCAISTDRIYSLDCSSGGVRPKPFIDTALERGASSVIIAHSHPYGPLFPSDADRQTTNMLKQALDNIGVNLVEHYVVCGDKYIGFLGGVSFGCTSQSKSEGHPVQKEEASALSLLLSYTKEEKATEKLLLHFGSLNNLLSARPWELEELISHKSAVLIRICSAIISRSEFEALRFGKKHDSLTVARGLKGLFFGEWDELVYALIYSSDGSLLSCDLISEGTPNGSEILPRKVIDAARRRGASVLSLAHNHPRGSANPSSDDIETTKKLGSLLLGADVKLVSHYVVSGQEIGEIAP